MSGFKSVEEKAKFYLSGIKERNEELNIYLSLNENLLKEAKALDLKKKSGKKTGRLFGYLFAVKSNINVAGLICNCASKTLENYRSGYDATVIEKIKKEDGLIIGMVNMDEFASGVTGESSAFGATKNPANLEIVPGGSSSGSAAAVAAGLCDVALGSDTGGSIRNPASNCGVIGVKPSYGYVSRYGLIDLSMSLDQIGPLGKNVEDVALVLDVIKGRDEKDTVTFEEIEEKDLQEKINLKKGKRKIGVLRVPGVQKEVQDLIDSKIQEVEEKLGWDIKEIEIDNLDLAVQTYYPLVYVEFFSGTRRFDGRKYGKKIEESAGREVLRRILGGGEISKAEYSGKYYEKALEVRKAIKESFENVFESVDSILLPVVPSVPWNLGESEKMNVEEVYAADALTCPANLAGICGTSIPAGDIKGVPIGLQILSAQGNDGLMLSIAKEIEGLQ